MNALPSSDITRIVLIVLVIGLLIVGSFLTLLPFLGALIWAVTIAVATWPLLMFVQQKTGGRRSVAVIVMTLLILTAFVAPLAVAVSTLLRAAGESPALVQDFVVRGLGDPPPWIATVPVVGERVSRRWQEIAAGGPDALAEFAMPYAGSAAAWVFSATGGIGRMFVQFLLILILTAIFYSQGETAARGALAFGRRIGDERGERTIVLAGQAIRSVALGVIVTAFVQSLLAGAGLWMSGVPHAGILMAVMFVLGIAQLGPTPVLVPSIIWLYWSGNAAWGTGLLIWSLPIAALDNVLRPILIRRGVQLPMLLIIGGVIGGLISFGVLGLFVGPVILAATYTLAREWVADYRPDEPAQS
ncbi:MAG TPA: AI-2E family transporter YdiK [Vicinamibacterales bacterium]|nr:AI-2E family transporter YdiK [Vicinamibacterales bacterium]